MTGRQPVRPEAEQQHLRNVLGALAVAIADLLDGDAAEHGRNGLEQAALVLVRTLPGMSQRDLQRRLGLSQPGTTRLLDRLAARGLLHRRSGPDDRTHALRLSAAGRAEADAARRRRHAVLARATQGLDPATSGTVARALDDMLAALIGGGSSPYRTCRLCDQHACTAGGSACPAEPHGEADGP